MTCFLASWVGRATAPSFFGASTLVTAARGAELEGAPAALVADAAWMLADPKTARRVTETELQRLYFVEGPQKSQILIRFALLDANPDGQRALYAQACVADPEVCADWRPAAQREHAKRVAAQLQLPSGHPPVVDTP